MVATLQDKRKVSGKRVSSRSIKKATLINQNGFQFLCYFSSVLSSLSRPPSTKLIVRLPYAALALE